MAGFAFRKNQIFNWNNSQFKIIRLQENGDILLEVDTDHRLSIVSKDTLLAEYRIGNISGKTKSILPKPAAPIFSRPLDELCERDRLEAKRRRIYLDKIFALGKPKFTKNYLTPIISAVALETNDASPPSPITVYRWYHKYRISNDSRSLIPRTDLRGSKQLRQKELTLKFAEEAIEEAYAISPQAHIPNIYARLTGKIEAENRKNPFAEPMVPPSERTLRRIHKRMDSYDVIRLKEGKKSADQKFYLIKHSVNSTRILERVEVDHTPLDLFIVDERTWLPLGRPTLTVFIDHYSRMLLGYFLTFAAPSAAAVIGALRHAILPKELKANNIPNLPIQHTWPCYGVPEALIVDNGREFHGNDLESVAFDLGIRIQYCPKYQPRFKGCVERYLKTINYSFANQLPGASLARFHLRGDYDPQKCALLTFGEFTHLFEKWVVDIYAQTLHKGIGTTPWARWHEGLSQYQPELPEDRRTLQRRIGQVKECKLQTNGITVNYINYTGDELKPLLIRYGHGIAMRVVFDPEDLGEIQVWGPGEQDPVRVSARDLCYASGLTLTQHQFIRKELSDKGAAEDRQATQRARYELALAIERLMMNRKQSARKRSAALRGITSSQPEGSEIGATEGLVKSQDSQNATSVTRDPADRAKTPSDDPGISALPPLLPTFTLSR